MYKKYIFFVGKNSLHDFLDVNKMSYNIVYIPMHLYVLLPSIMNFSFEEELN